MYCPQFSDSDFMYGDYYSIKATWYRLVVHMCNTQERELEGKTCASLDEVEHFV